jgi:hypothetical protein
VNKKRVSQKRAWPNTQSQAQRRAHLNEAREELRSLLRRHEKTHMAHRADIAAGGQGGEKVAGVEAVIIWRGRRR